MNTGEAHERLLQTIEAAVMSDQDRLGSGAEGAVVVSYIVIADVALPNSKTALIDYAATASGTQLTAWKSLGPLLMTMIQHAVRSIR